MLHAITNAVAVDDFSFVGSQTQGTRESVDCWELPPIAVVAASFAGVLGIAEEQRVHC